MGRKNIDLKNVEELIKDSKNEDLNLLLKIIKADENLNIRDEFGATALFYAVYEGNLKIVRTLLRSGSDPNVANNANFTPLMIAVEQGFYDIVKLLIDFGANVNIVDNEGDDALTLCIKMIIKGLVNNIDIYIKIINLLIAKGGEFNFSNPYYKEFIKKYRITELVN